MALRALSPVSKLTRYMGDASAIVRERKGLATYASVGDLPVSRVAMSRIFTASELFDVYRLCPDIRAPVDLVSLRVAQTKWSVSPRVGILKGTALWRRAARLAEQVTKFLERPNQDETWHAFAQKWAQDALLYDATATEHARNKSGAIEELVEWRGGDVSPLQDEHGRVYRYRQDVTGTAGSTVYFLPEDLTYANIFCNTTFPNGLPLIETLVEEFLTMRASSVHFRRAVDADEVPPGILFLAGVADIAYQRLEDKMKIHAGRDDVLRMVNSFDKAGSANWIQFTRSPKDLEWVPNVQATRETIWRVFHVSPVQMGQTANTPRASAEVQLQIGDMVLINAMLIRLADIANLRWLPDIAALFGPREAAELLSFGFDTSTALSQSDQKLAAERVTMMWDRGLLTSDEARAEFGYDPLIESKDPDLEEDGTDPTAEDGADGADVAEGEDAAATKRPRLSAQRRGVEQRAIRRLVLLGEREALSREHVAAMSGTLVRVANHPGPVLPSARWRHPTPLVRALPSGWQPASRFKGAKVLPLTQLAELVDGYDAIATGLYERARRKVLKDATAAVADGTLDAAAAATIASSIATSLNTLAADWSTETGPSYTGAAELGYDTAREWDGAEVAWRNTATRYHGDAMGYLTATTPTAGLIATLRMELLALLIEATRRAPLLPPRPAPSRDMDDTEDRAESKLPAALGAFLEGIRRVFDRNQHRISNWSGKLVELAHGVLTESLHVSDRQAVVADGGEADPWLVEWVEVADRATCGTCKAEGAKGWRRLSELVTMPGGATECGARCRCLLQFARKSEVDSGAAKRLGPVK